MAYPVLNQQLTTREQEVIGKLLIEALGGEIQPQTREALYDLGPMYNTEPYGHLVRFAQGYAMDNKSLARALTEEIRAVCVEMLDPNYPPST